jgi:hypothetical protein
MKQTVHPMAILIVLTIFAFSARGQSWTWDTLGAGGGELCPDRTGGYYQWSSNSNTNSNITLRRVTGNGTLLWQFDIPLNGNIRSIACAEDSSLYVAGVHSGSVMVGNNVLYRRNIFISRYSPSGNLIWMKTIKGDFWEDYCAVSAYSGNRVVITGMVRGQVNMMGLPVQADNMPQYFVARFDAQGNVQAVATASTILNGSSAGGRICTDNSGNIFTTLTTSAAPVSLGPASFTHASSTYLVKMDSSLQLLWRTRLPDFSYLAPSWGPETWQMGETWVTRIRANALGDLYVLEGQINNSCGDGLLSCYNASGVRTATYSAWQLPGHPKSQFFHRQRYLTSFDIDTCGNVYVLGAEIASGLNCAVYTNNHILRMTPSLQVVWLHTDKADLGNVTYQWLGDLDARSPNRCFVTGSMSHSVQLKNILQTNYPSETGFYASFEAVNSPPVISSASSLSLCAGKSVTLAASANGDVSWYSSAAGTTPVGNGFIFNTGLLSAGVHTFYAEASSCTITSGRSSVVVNALPQPVISVSGGTVCQGQQFALAAVGALSYTFSSASNVVVPQGTTVYTVTGTGSNGCIGQGTSAVFVNTLPAVNILCLNMVCPGQAQVMQGLGAQSYTWSTGLNAANISIAPKSTTTYTLLGTGTNGCINSMAVTVSVTACGDVTGFGAEAFRIYPNPAHGLVHFVGAEFSLVRIYDLHGRHCATVQASGGTIDLSGLDPGIYYLAANSEKVRLVIY